MTRDNRSNDGVRTDAPFWTGGMTEEPTLAKTCANGPCSCEIRDDLEHCGPSCRMGIGGDSEQRCFCGHAQCSASTGEAPSNL